MRAVKFFNFKPTMKNVKIEAKDGYKLSAHLFEPENPNGKFLIVNSATGVRQQVYFNFANHLSKKGFTVLTYDYRGIGESKPKKMKGFVGSMRMWGSEDFAGISEYVFSKYSSFDVFCLGHSVGALIAGMNPDSLKIKKFVFIATQKAYVGNLDFKTKLLAYSAFSVFLPLSTNLLGYFPAHWFGLGETLPKGTAFDWQTLILNKKSTNKLLESIPDYSKKLTQDVTILEIQDDSWVTRKGIESLMSETYPNMNYRIRRILTSESQAGEIGHVNFFRSYNEKLWQIIVDELL